MTKTCLLSMVLATRRACEMPFTVVTLKSVPPSLRGDLTKWMQEIATGVYIGNFNSRIERNYGIEFRQMLVKERQRLVITIAMRLVISLIR